MPTYTQGLGTYIPAYYGADDLVALMSEGALYDVYKIPRRMGAPLLNTLSHVGLRIDAHCLGCARDSTFVLNPVEEELRKTLEESPNGTVIDPVAGRLGWIGLHCARRPHDETHNIIFCMICDLEGEGDDALIAVRKIGQWPSVADIAGARFKEYERLIDAQDLAELRRAVGLSAHGIGIGSFVYLRRIFERLISQAEARANNGSAAERPLLRMDERIDAVREFLPEFVVQNRKFYGIVSAGVHELTEAECIKAFPIVETAIVLMLDEVSVARRREARLKDAQNKLAQLHDQLVAKQKLS